MFIKKNNVGGVRLRISLNDRMNKKDATIASPVYIPDDEIPEPILRNLLRTDVYPEPVTDSDTDSDTGVVSEPDDNPVSDTSYDTSDEESSVVVLILSLFV